MLIYKIWRIIFVFFLRIIIHIFVMENDKCVAVETV